MHLSFGLFVFLLPPLELVKEEILCILFTVTFQYLEDVLNILDKRINEQIIEWVLLSSCKVMGSHLEVILNCSSTESIENTDIKQHEVNQLPDLQRQWSSWAQKCLLQQVECEMLKRNEINKVYLKKWHRIQCSVWCWQCKPQLRCSKPRST